MRATFEVDGTDARSVLWWIELFGFRDDFDESGGKSARMPRRAMAPASKASDILAEDPAG